MNRRRVSPRKSKEVSSPRDRAERLPSVQELRTKILIYQDLGDDDNVKELLNFLLSAGEYRDSLHWSDFFHYGRALLVGGHLRALDSFLDKFYTLNPSNFNALFQLLRVQLYLRQSDHGTAIEALNASLSKPIDSWPTKVENVPTGWIPQSDVAAIKSRMHQMLSETLRLEAKFELAGEHQSLASAADHLNVPAAGPGSFPLRPSSPSEGRLGSSWQELMTGIQATYKNCKFHECITQIERLKRHIFYNEIELADVLAGCYFELGMETDIFALAHRLSKEDSSPALFLYAAGLYYILSDKRDQARAFLIRACNAKKSYVPAWMALGHTFSALGDHDQALAAYARIICHIDPRCFEARIAIAIEHGRAKRFFLAAPYISDAYALANKDPFVLNELGSLFYSRKDIYKAIDAFERALDACRGYGGPIESVVRQNYATASLPILSKLHSITEIQDFVTKLEQRLTDRLADSTVSLILRELVSFIDADPSGRRSSARHVIACSMRLGRSLSKTRMDRLLKISATLNEYINI